jgi:hypothetical protein
MSQKSNQTSTTLPTARKSRRTSQRNRPVLVSSTSQGTQESQGDQIEQPKPESRDARVRTEPLTVASVATETPVKARRVPHLPSFFSKVEKTVEEPETSQEEIVKARLARAQKGTPKAEATPTASTTKAQDEKKPARGTNRTATTASSNKLFKTRHFIGMAFYLLAAELLLPLETSLFRQLGIEKRLAEFNLFNIPMIITSSVLLNLATLVIFLLILVKFDLLPSSMGGRRAATAQAQQREQRAAERLPQPTVRQGVKGEHDDLYRAYRTNQRKEKKH